MCNDCGWDYAQSIAPDIFVFLGKILGILEVILNVMMFLFHTSYQLALTVGGCLGVVFLLFGFYKTDMEIEKRFERNVSRETFFAKW